MRRPFDRLFAADVRAPYFLVGALAPKMADRGGCSIITIASMTGQVGLAGGAVYGATKAALPSMTRSCAAELSPSGVPVQCRRSRARLDRRGRASRKSWRPQALRPYSRLAPAGIVGA